VSVPGRLAVAFASVTLVGTGGCASSGANKAGGPDTPRPRALTMVSGLGFSGAEQLVSIIEEAKRLSGGTIRIELLTTNWRPGQVAFENGLIRDIRAGKADLGVAGSRAFDSVGVMSLRALHTPFLIDSYALEARVLASPLIREMLLGLEAFELVGLGVLPGPMRKPAGIAHALVEPSDYQGVTIGIKQSRIADETMRALGARPVPYAAGGKITPFGGSELDIQTIDRNGHDQDGLKYVTANVNLWPRPLVVFASHKLFDSLTSEQQTLLKRAVAEVAPGAVAAERASDRKSAANLCRRRVDFVNASDDALAALRRAVQPVYDRLERDLETKTFIARIEAMRRQVGTPHDTVHCRARRINPGGS
jgi:TRAP-type C4-dicarboxylate transport system substrate-binding protein